MESKDEACRGVICQGCEQRLTEASTAMRRHASHMNQAIEMARRGPTEEEKKDIRATLVASFNDAQSAWDTYRDHITEHGLLPSLPLAS
jgi:hypothetical protein